MSPPLLVTDDMEPRAGPPLPGKAHPRADMDAVVPTLDDEVGRFHKARDQRASGFGVDPDAADAAADLAGDLGSTFLSGATLGEDMSELAASGEDMGENEMPLVLDEGMNEGMGGEDLPRAAGSSSAFKPPRSGVGAASLKASRSPRRR